MSWSAPREGSLAGVIVHLTNMNGGWLETAMIRRAVALGWGVLSVNPAATGTRNIGTVTVSTSLEYAPGVVPPRQKLLVARYLQYALSYGAYLFASTTQSACAAEAALQDLECIDSRTIGSPVVVVGVSNGAMLSPGVAALLSERVRAVVLLAGGGTFFDVSVTSSLVADRPTPEAFASVRGEVLRAYREANPLDAIAAAPMISRTPVLQIVPMFDHIVPTRLQMDLWRALGKPERWDVPFGHIGMMVFEASIFERVDGWLRAQLQIPAVKAPRDGSR
jgi:pimeloyl-ACP methyl ester carboxylesterase